MNRAKIIETNEAENVSILYESMHPYLKSLYIYYKAEFNCEPILAVFSVYNASQYCKIVPEKEFVQAIEDYYKDTILEDELEDQIELVSFQSKYLKDLIQ